MRQTTGMFCYEANGSGFRSNQALRHIERFAPGTLQKGLYQFDEPVSPHIAAQSKTVGFLLPSKKDSC